MKMKTGLTQARIAAEMTSVDMNGRLDPRKVDGKSLKVVVEGGGAGLVVDVDMSELAGSCGVCVVGEAIREALAITLMCQRWC